MKTARERERNLQVELMKVKVSKIARPRNHGTRISLYIYISIFPKQCLHYGVLNLFLGLVTDVPEISKIAGIPGWDPNSYLTGARRREARGGSMRQNSSFGSGRLAEVV